MSNMNGGVMKSQRARVGAGYQPPALPFAQLPNPDSVLGRVYIASDVGPAPGIELIAAPGRWRPRGGRQVLAMRGTAITLQNLTFANIDAVGPFPGGLVRAGMGLEFSAFWRAPAVSTGLRYLQVGISATPINQTLITNELLSFPYNINTLSGGLRAASRLNAANDTTGPHPTGLAYTTPFGSDANSLAVVFVTTDLSQPWYLSVTGQSVAENAVNISSATWAGGIATFNTSAAHTLAVGDKTVTAGVTPSGWNIPAGAIVLSVPTTTQFTVALAADPGAYTSGGTSSRISNVTSQSYVIELVG